MSFPSLSGEQHEPVMEEVLGVTEFQDLRLVVIGNTGAGKSASANKILRRRQFLSKPGANSVTRKCQYGSTDFVEDDDPKRMRSVTVVDMPGFGDTRLSKEEIHTEIAKCLSVSAPGPHAFLLVVPIGRYTDNEDQAVINLANIFGDDAVKHHTVVVFTRGDDLEDMEFEEYLKDSPPGLQDLIDKCGGRYQVFDNKNGSNVAQVKELIMKVDKMVKQSKTGFYTNAMFEEAEAAIREEQRRMEMELETDKKEKKHNSQWPRKRKLQREEKKRKRRESSRDSKKTREEAFFSPKVLERLKCMVAAGLVGLAVGVAFGIAVPLAAASSASLVGKVVGLAAVKLTGASAVGVGNAVGAVVAAASGKTALAVGAAAGGLVGGAIGVVNGSEAQSVKEGACDTFEQVRDIGLFASEAAVVVGAALGAGAAVSAALVPQGANGASVAVMAAQNAPASVGALAAETPAISSAAGAAKVVEDAVKLAPATEGRSTIDAISAVGKAVAAVASTGGLVLKVVKCKSKDSEKTSYKFSWNK
ncbi:uncharacterized protein LOC144043547 [Vanacampus margaritifer]